MNSREQVALNVAEWKKQGLKVGMASGAFDLLHAGHLSFLCGMRGNVDKLVVAVTCDETCWKKADNRPVIPDWQRGALVAALGCVDDAFIFTEYGDNENLEAILPDVFGRGDGYTGKIYEAETVKRLGIELLLIDTPRITSTTEIINRIRK